MRVLLALHGFPPESLGGTELHAAWLAQELARSHEVAVLCGSAELSSGHIQVRSGERGGVRVHALSHRPTGFDAYRDVAVARRCLEVLEAEAPDVLHVHHLAGLSTGLVFGARERGVPVVATLHDFATLCALGQLLTLDLRVCPGPEPGRCLSCVGGAAATAALGGMPGAAGVAGGLARLLGLGRGRVAARLAEMRRVLAAAQVRIAPSRFLRERFEGLGVGDVEVLANGHPRLPARERAHAPDGRVRFGYVGSLIPSKGVHVLAEAWRRTRPEGATLAIHGPAPAYHGERGYAERVRRHLGDEGDAILRGPFPPERLGDVLAKLDVLVVPSLWEENAPLVVHEAFLAGLPVIVSDHGGLAEAVRHEVDGLRVAPGDPVALGEALRRLAGDGALRARLSADAPPVPTMAEHVHGLLGLYAVARDRARERRA